MLFYAINDTTFSADEAQKGVTYHCPECQGRVRLRGGQLRRLHFYHLKEYHSCRHNGKSHAHLRLQQSLAPLLSAHVEYHFPSIRRIADLYSPKKNLVVEVQCSPLSIEEMERRNHDYASLNLRVVWILLERRFRHHHFRFAHYFTNGYTLYDRLEGERFRVDLSQEIPVPQGIKLPNFLKEREIAFVGDLTHRYCQGLLHLPKRRLFSLRALVHLTLEALTR